MLPHTNTWRILSVKVLFSTLPFVCVQCSKLHLWCSPSFSTAHWARLHPAHHCHHHLRHWTPLASIARPPVSHAETNILRNNPSTPKQTSRYFSRKVIHSWNSRSSWTYPPIGSEHIIWHFHAFSRPGLPTHRGIAKHFLHQLVDLTLPQNASLLRLKNLKTGTGSKVEQSRALRMHGPQNSTYGHQLSKPRYIPCTWALFQDLL